MDEMKETREYTFTAQEQGFFERQRQQINAAVMSMNNAIGLLLAQQGLPGEWRMKMDGTGIERVDGPMLTMPVEEPKGKRVNGVAER